MTQGSNIGYQPVSLTPPDLAEFIQYRRNLTSMLRGTLHQPSKEIFSEKPDKKSKQYHKDVKRRNRNRRE